MSFLTLAEARDALYTALLEVDVQVLDHVPRPGDARNPVVIVDMNGAFFDAADVTIPVRAYMLASTPGVEQAQALFVDLVDELDDVIGGESWRCNASLAYVEGSDCWVADMRVVLPR